MLRRIDDLGREILAGPAPHGRRTAGPQVSALVRLGDKTLAVLGQLRAAPAAQPANDKRTTVGPGATASVVPEGVAVLLAAIVCALGMALVSATRQLDLARRR